MKKVPLQIVGLAILYYLMGRLGTLTAIPPGVATVIWPPSGLSLAALLLLGNRVWPGIFLGSSVLNFGILESQSPTTSLLSLAVAISIAVGSILQPMLGAALIRRYSPSTNPFGGASGVFRFVLIGLIGCLVSATIGTSSLALGGFAPWTLFRETWVTWWLGDTVGILVVTPLILVWTNKQHRIPLERKLVLEGSLLAVVLLVTSHFVFGVPFAHPSPRLPLAYVFLPLIVGSAFRLGLPGGVSAIFLTSVLAIWGTINGTTIFMAAGLNGSLLAVQSFVAVAAITGLMLGAVLMERRRSDQEKSRLLAEETRLRLELARSNKDLERFARIASHDLREPLRTIMSQLELLNRSMGDKLSEESKANLHFAIDGSERMTHLIESLLEFSRPGADTAEFQPVACDAVLKDVLLNLKVSLDEKGAEVRSGSLPTIRGDQVQIGQLFQNLISNAIKYQAGKTPIVSVSALEKRGEWVFSVKDNGIGFDMKYSDRIFQMFQRLHGRNEYPGAGLGLAVCRRIVERHGGKIWAESEVGKGSVFFFQIPVSAPHEAETRDLRTPL